MTSKYFPAEFENKWVSIWDEEKMYQVRYKKQETRNKQDPKSKIQDPKSTYVLAMFPYPSGAGLHVGHVRIYTGTDILARYFRMKGHSVLHPMGWDAFGLPAENAAIKAKKNPMDMVSEHIATFKRQMKSLGFSYDWSREFATTDPEYYKWTQWLFIQFFKAGLLYKKNTDVNFCPKCKTGLAEEEVTSEGTHERCGTPITKKMLPQWMFRITQYAERLLEGLGESDRLDWPRGILEMQKNWIGRSEGVEINFNAGPVSPSSQASYLKYPLRLGPPPSSTPATLIKVFTTRPDTILGVSFMAISPEKAKEFIEAGWEPSESVRDYIDKCLKMTDKERLARMEKKTGVDTGLMAINPANGDKVPIWVADYVLGAVGTGAIMGVPAYDERDNEFAKEFGLPIKKAALTNKRFGEKKIKYKLRDWIFSRQRYWGEPIPMIFCEKCDKWMPVVEEDLPVELPYVKSYEPTDTGESPLAKIKDWVNVKCPECGGTARRETDTMPNWAGSCWYYLYFAKQNKGNPKYKAQITNQIQNPNDSKLFDIWTLKLGFKGNSWLPVDWYLGGAEHAVLHLLYARFWTKAMADLGLVDFTEPFIRLRNVGIVLAEDHRKMSKSYGNVINPDQVVKEYGADTLRIYESFMAPFDTQVEWSTKAVAGSYRFLQRIWQIYHNPAKVTKRVEEEDKELALKLQRLILKISNDITNVKFNTCISSMMEFLNEWEKKKLSIENSKKFLKLLAPFAPFITEEIWREVFGEKGSIHLSSWPEANLSAAKDRSVKIPVQVNGKVRAIIIINDQLSTLNQEKIVQIALKDPKVAKWVEGKKYEVIYVEGKILNFVLVD